MRGKDGHIHRRVKIRVILPEGTGIKPLRFEVKAGPHRGFGDTGIDEVLEHAAQQIEKRFPLWEFRLVPIAENAFNFIYAGLREQAKGDSRNETVQEVA
jgi:hypothetical protein